jgi:hypothetical protein
MMGASMWKLYLNAYARLINDNSGQFVSKDLYALFSDGKALLMENLFGSAVDVNFGRVK